jgi:hypothetical protein
MDILEMLTSLSGKNPAFKQLNQSVNVDPEKVEKTVQLGIPMLMEALNRNSNTSQGAQDLANALEQHKDDKVDDLVDFLQNVDTEDGSKILQHIFANKNKDVQSNLSKTTGLKQDQVGSILAKIAPLLLGALGNQKKEQNLDANGISNLTSSLSQNLQQAGGGSLFSMATKLLDTNKNGSILDEIMNFFGRRK